MVSTVSILMMFISLAAGIVLPLALFLFLRKKFKASPSVFLMGCVTWALFAVVLEGIFHRLILGSPLGAVIQGTTLYYAIYGGLAAGLFEETGRYLIGKRLFKKGISDDANALMFGAGHGGLEAFYILVFGMISNLAVAFMINGGQSEVLLAGQPEEYASVLRSSFDALINTAPYMFLLGIIERIGAMALHVAFSVVVWFGIKNNKIGYYILAILMHAFVDAITVILAGAMGPELIEVILYIIAAVYLYTAWLIYKKEHVEEKEAAEV